MLVGINGPEKSTMKTIDKCAMQQKIVTNVLASLRLEKLTPSLGIVEGLQAYLAGESTPEKLLVEARNYPLTEERQPNSFRYSKSTAVKNKAGINDQRALDVFEINATAIRLVEIDLHPVPGGFNMAHLKAIYQHLFQDVYSWAGKLCSETIRESDRIPLGNWERNENHLGGELDLIYKENFLIGSSPDHFVERLAHYMGQINIALPFREGNGRIQRTFCNQLAKQANYFIDYSEMEYREWLWAMATNFRHDSKPLESLLGRSIAIIE